mgnify:CR=1 FL=1
MQVLEGDRLAYHILVVFVGVLLHGRQRTVGVGAGSEAGAGETLYLHYQLIVDGNLLRDMHRRGLRRGLAARLEHAVCDHQRDCGCPEKKDHQVDHLGSGLGNLGGRALLGGE